MPARRPRWLARACAVAMIAATGGAAVPATAHAEGLNRPALWLYDLGVCTFDSVGLNCSRPDAISTPALVQAVATEPGQVAVNAPLRAQHRYIVCWTTLAGQTLPAGTDCAEPSRGVDVAGEIPAEITVSGCSLGKSGFSNTGWTLLRASSAGQACVVQISTPDASGLTGATTRFEFPVALSEVDIDGQVRSAPNGTGRVGRSAMLQHPRCPAAFAQGGPRTTCSAITLNWEVVSGGRSCQVVVQSDLGGPLPQVRDDYGMVSVRFIRPGRCQVQGTYPEQPGRTAAYATGIYRFTVRR